MRKRRVRIVALLAAAGVAAWMATGATVTAAASAGRTATSGQPGSVAPNKANDLDCNGWSTKYKNVRAANGELCTDPVIVKNGKAYSFVDNGHYIGHDEPSVKFISSRPGSGNNFTFLTRLSADPKRQPTVSSGKVSDYAELSPAPWFGMAVCDPKSYPQNPCTPDSDTNSGEINNPNDAGSAFLELQFYPPGYAPFIEGPSCDPTKWCAALTIDSVESDFNFVNLNPACQEPVNFAYLQRDGVPAGPPSPQLTDVSTFAPNNETLLMNPGDVVSTSIHDTPNGLISTVHDFSTGQTGFMVASGSNGFMNTNLTDCSGTPFNFHPEYSTAEQQNQTPWAALEGGVLMEQEIGHFEPCNSVSNSFPVVDNFGDGQSFTDNAGAQTCDGGFEGPNATGEGPCVPNAAGTGFACTNVTAQDGSACPTGHNLSAAHCEFSDALCLPAGPRPVNSNGVAETFSWPIASCLDNIFQNGDLDFDGSSYVADWPNGTRHHPSTFEYIGPFTDGGHTYPQIQFETDVAASENLCDEATGVGCVAPPAGAAFYPFWTLGQGVFGCEWNFGNVIKHHTVQTFGQDAQYGVSDFARFGGTLTSPVMSNPQLSGCGANARK